VVPECRESRSSPLCPLSLALEDGTLFFFFTSGPVKQVKGDVDAFFPLRLRVEEFRGFHLRIGPESRSIVADMEDLAVLDLEDMPEQVPVGPKNFAPGPRGYTHHQELKPSFFPSFSI